MSPSTLQFLVVLLTTACSIAAALDSNATDTSSCPSDIQSLLTSPRYADCQRDVGAFRDTGAWPAWVFTMSEKDAIHGSEACMTTLLDLRNVLSSGACQTTVSGPRGGSTIHVTVAKAALDQVAAACRRLRRLRSASTQQNVTESSTNDATSQQNATQALV